MLRTYNVFEINTQVQGLESKRETFKNDNEPIEEAKEVIKNYFRNNESLKFKNALGIPHYTPSIDEVSMPNISEFISSEDYLLMILNLKIFNAR